MNNFQQLNEALSQSVLDNNFVKLTLSKPIRKSDGLPNVYIRLVKIKGAELFQFTYHYSTNDKVKNYTIEEAITELEVLLVESFRAAMLFTLANDLMVFISKKKVVSYKLNTPSFTNKLPETHDKPKERLAEAGSYLTHLGITDKSGKVIHKMADKYRQINKYLEIIEGLLKSTKLPKHINIVDMGSGKGYLTFALYDYLVNTKKFNATVTGIELRTELVDFCNDVAKKCEFENLSFVAQPIQEYDNNKIDILIALHACDTATDDAIYKGLASKAELIICAPCCHKQIRQQVKGKEQESPLLKYGIFKERQFEMVTDTIRALILEKYNYNTKVFEFINNEHTRKNVMLVGTKSSKNSDVSKVESKISELKKAYLIDTHYLETLL
ncbi:MAG: SAM-dependent methyltransferase [Polaribacter sp.]|jgi:SAM-dependent methyltransferase